MIYTLPRLKVLSTWSSAYSVVAAKAGYRRLKIHFANGSPLFTESIQLPDLYGVIHVPALCLVVKALYLQTASWEKRVILPDFVLHNSSLEVNFSSPRSVKLADYVESTSALLRN